MRFTNLKFNFSSLIDNIKIIRIIIIAIITAIIALFSIFLYNDFYQTIVQAKIVVVLRQEVAVENIDIKRFNQILSKHDYKTTELIPIVIPDPFATEPKLITEKTENEIIQN